MAKLFFSMGLLFGILKLLTGCSDSFWLPKYGYNIKKGKVFYKRPFPDPVIEMQGVDITTFKIRSRVEDSAYADNTYYATDKNNVYYRGVLVPGGDGPSFELITVNYAKDKSQCYYMGRFIKDADPQSFVVKSDNFSADKHHIFKRDITVDTDASVFETFYDGYVVHTANTVCVYDDVVPIPAGARFQYLAYAYFALNGQVYHHHVPMPDAVTTGFTAIDNFYSKTADHVYYGSKLIAGANPASYKLFSAPYGRDNRHVFFFENIIEGADAASFEIINTSFQCARDKNALYHEGRKITNYTPADFANKKACINCNESSIYFAEQ